MPKMLARTRMSTLGVFTRKHPYREFRGVVAICFGFLIANPAFGANTRLLGQGDVVELSVYGQLDLSTVGRLGEGGSLNVPLIGEVLLAGLSERGGERKIARLLSERRFVKNPHVSLYIRDYLSHQVSVLGYVREPGRYPFESGDSVVNLIAVAGGFTEEARGSVILTRKTANDNERHYIDVARVLTDGTEKEIESVQDGDVLFAVKMDVFYVYGEVQEPGMFRLEREMTVMHALAVAGSLTDKGSARGIQIRRDNGAGSAQTLRAKLTDVLEPNDVIRVKESLF